jgi:ribose 5-phosphate isomerase RpiB
MDAKLVNQIVEQVLAALGRSGAAAPAPPSAAPAVSTPPGGQGGPSEDKAVRETVSAAVRQQRFRSQYAPAWAPARKEESVSDSAPRPRVFITAEMLRQRLAEGAAHGAIELAENEFLTPSAQDLADQKHLTVRKVPPPIGVAPATVAAAPGSEDRADNQGGPADGDPWALGLIVEKADDKVRNLLAGLRREGLSITNYGQTDCWVCNLGHLCKALAAGQVRAGVAILPHAADAMMLASKHKGVRAVQGTRPRSVSAAMRHFAANLLVLEHAYSTVHEMKTMIRLLAGQTGAAFPAGRLLEAVKELEKA